MALPEVVSREQWLQARLPLLAGIHCRAPISACPACSRT